MVGGLPLAARKFVKSSQIDVLVAARVIFFTRAATGINLKSLDAPDHQQFSNAFESGTPYPTFEGLPPLAKW